jgi:integrase
MPNGKVKYGYIYGKSHEETGEKLKLVKQKCVGAAQNGKAFGGLLREFLPLWLARLEQQVKPSTHAVYHRNIRVHILPALGELRADKISCKNVSAFVELLREKGLSGRTIGGIVRLLQSILKDAVPGEDFRVELPKANRNKVPVLTKTEQAKLERTALYSGSDSAAVMLALYTGMRLGELCALRWRDVDLDEGIIHVRQTVQRIEIEKAGGGHGGRKTALVIGSPKTQSSERAVPIPSLLLHYLRGLMENSAGEYVLGRHGQVSDPRTVQYRFCILLQKSGIKRINFHALRHTYATRCLEKQIDVTTLSQLLGHTSPKMTLDVYTDSLMEHKQQAVQVLNTHCMLRAA